MKSGAGRVIAGVDRRTLVSGHAHRHRFGPRIFAADRLLIGSGFGCTETEGSRSQVAGAGDPGFGCASEFDLARKSGSRAFDATGVVRLRIGCCSGMIRVVQPCLGGSGKARCDGPDLFEWHETDNRWVGPLS